MKTAEAPRGRWAPAALSTRSYAALGAALVCALVLTLHALGRPFGFEGLRVVGVSEGVNGSEALFDGYSLLHASGGLALRALMRATSAHWPQGWSILVALASSVVWEAAENTPLLIEAFAEGSGPNYTGDTILNALGDTACVLLGFETARRLPYAAILAGAALVEAAMASVGLYGFAANAVRIFTG